MVFTSNLVFMPFKQLMTEKAPLFRKVTQLYPNRVIQALRIAWKAILCFMWNNRSNPIK